MILEKTEKKNLSLLLDRASWYQDGKLSDKEVDKLVKKELDKTWVITKNPTDDDFPFMLYIDGVYIDDITLHCLKEAL